MARANAGDSARRLIALLGKMTEGAELPIDQLAKSLGTTPTQLAGDLESLCTCGVAPYTPDCYIDAFVVDGVLEVNMPLPAVRSAVRLSTTEAAALVSALSATGFPADDPLTSRLLSASAAGFDAESLERTLLATIATHDGLVFETLASAVRDHSVVAISYQSDGTASPTDRDVEPLRLFADRGAWYLSAWCRTAGAFRTFRIDRIRAAAPTAERFQRVAGTDDGAALAFVPDGLPYATLRFTPGETFIEREWPGGRVVSEEPDGSTLAEVPFGGTPWIARRIVARLGAVEALGPAEVREAVAELADATGRSARR
ncbi:MAG: WYL domain-containing protein [Coriobacteriia bacterium]|nr:WYL domain-containing protein [Coriobacteriia bacterium]